MAEISLAMSNHKVSLDFLFHYHRYGATCHPDALPHEEVDAYVQAGTPYIIWDPCDYGDARSPQLSQLLVNPIISSSMNSLPRS